jgi:N-acetylglucosaminyldiphosphoundecaprenol N-acetyl-beta-D-mannosaminyltransferase
VRLEPALDLVCSRLLTDAVAEAEQWIEAGRQGVICFANVHVIEMARRSATNADALSRAELVLADGAPVAWALGHLCRRPSPRVAGSDFFVALCGRKVGDYRHFLLGSTPQTLLRLDSAVRHRFPGILIVGTHSPRFGSWDENDYGTAVDAVNSAAPDVVWVGMGAPKQELWMDAMRGRVSAPVLAGVGAAFDFVSGEKRRAPLALQRAGLEWAHRLACEPRRLVGRYLQTNTTFLVGVLGAIIRQEWRS